MYIEEFEKNTLDEISYLRLDYLLPYKISGFNKIFENTNTVIETDVKNSKKIAAKY